MVSASMCDYELECFWGNVCKGPFDLNLILRGIDEKYVLLKGMYRNKIENIFLAAGGV